jgi:hypothetical protein
MDVRIIMLTQISQTPRCLFLIGLAAGFMSLLSGCAQLSATYSSPWSGDQESTCLSKFAKHDKLIANERRRDAQNTRLVRHPFLRVNRLLEALKPTLDSADKRRAWITRLAMLDQQSRRLENSNLASGWDDLSSLDKCRTLLVERVLQNDKIFATVLNAAAVSDNYSFSKRLAGLYPLTRWPVYFGALKLHDNEKPRPVFNVTENTQYYSFASPQTTRPNHVSVIPPPHYGALQHDSLGFPLLSSNVLLAQLLDAYAPIWAIETRTPADQLGALIWSGGNVKIDGAPTSYRHVAYVPFEGKILVQLLYTVWFPSVPAKKALDIYAGDIDGLTFRVTLDHELQPLLADIMHNCGCYYMAFPSPQLTPRPALTPYEEPLWVPYPLNGPKGRERYIIHLSAGNHFVESVSTTDSPQRAPQTLEVLPYDSLRSLPHSPGFARSAFSSRGLIENSHRLERYILWPMGIASAGAMRQSGHHGIAFVGRRHFDDPDLISRYFERANVETLPIEN